MDGDGSTRLSPVYLLLYSPLTPLSYINQFMCFLVIILNIHVNGRAGKLEGKDCGHTEETRYISSINKYKNRKLVKIK
jgi:hypothetical protein